MPLSSSLPPPQSSLLLIPSPTLSLLPTQSDAAPGPGTYLGPEDDIYASVAGRVALQPAASPSGRAAVSVTGRRGAQQGLVPRVGDVVICRVTNVSQRMAKMEVQCLGTRALEGGFMGVLRQEHVRATGESSLVVSKDFPLLFWMAKELATPMSPFDLFCDGWGLIVRYPCASGVGAATQSLADLPLSALQTGST